jgi:hypothetical protein
MGSVQFLAAAVAVTVAGIVNSNALISLAEVGSAATLLVLAALIMGRVKPTNAESARSRPTG